MMRTTGQRDGVCLSQRSLLLVRVSLRRLTCSPTSTPHEGNVRQMAILSLDRLFFPLIQVLVFNQSQRIVGDIRLRRHWMYRVTNQLATGWESSSLSLHWAHFIEHLLFQYPKTKRLNYTLRAPANPISTSSCSGEAKQSQSPYGAQSLKSLKSRSVLWCS